MEEVLKILKPKTRPVQIEPWFFRYLNAGQIKVLSAIIAHADYSTRTSNSFASNKTIAFLGGFGMIVPDTKDYEYYQTLSEQDKEAFKKKKEKNAIATVKNIKADLEKLGVITREVQGTKSYVTLDLEWGKERYLKEFDEAFNASEIIEIEDDNIQDELSQLSELVEAGNISKDNLASKLAELSQKIKQETSSETKSSIPKEDIEKTVDHYMATEKIQTKINNKQIKNVDGYRAIIKTKIEQGNFRGINELYKGLVQKEKEDIKELVFATYTSIEQEGVIYIPQVALFNEHNLIYIKFKNARGSHEVNYVAAPERIDELFSSNDYTSATQSFIKQYAENYKKAASQHQGAIEELKKTG